MAENIYIASKDKILAYDSNNLYADKSTVLSKGDIILGERFVYKNGTFVSINNSTNNSGSSGDNSSIINYYKDRYAIKDHIKVYRINERKVTCYLVYNSDNFSERHTYYTQKVKDVKGIVGEYKTKTTINAYDRPETRNVIGTIGANKLIKVDIVAYGKDLWLHVTNTGTNSWVRYDNNIGELLSNDIGIKTYDEVVNGNGSSGSSGGGSSGSESGSSGSSGGGSSGSESSDEEEIEVVAREDEGISAIVQDAIDEARARMEGRNAQNYIEYLETLAALEEDLTMKSARGIMGLPYQWMPHQDSRLDGSTDLPSIGRKFGDKILSKVPILFITPGLPQFLSVASEEERNGILSLFTGSNADTDALTELLKKDRRYYSLNPQYVDYFNYVNGITRLGARYLNLHGDEYKLDGVNLDQYNWYEHRNKAMGSFLGPYAGALAFYINSETSISDSFGNSTTQSAISSMINGMSDQAKELSFILGAASSEFGFALDSLIDEEKLSQSIQEQGAEIYKIFHSSNNIFSSLASKFKNIATGGKMIFPEIWSDSDFSRSYNVSIKLVTPDNDKLSWFLNIFVPLCHLLCLVLPRESGDVNTYRSPFLIRAFYKGLFNIDLGIITDLNVNKGADGSWTKDGLPTTVEVSFTLKDLYQHLTMSSISASGSFDLFSNIALMDYIGNWCGININEPDLFRSIDLFLTQTVVNQVKDALTLNLFGKLGQAINTKTIQIFASLFN